MNSQTVCWTKSTWPWSPARAFGEEGRGFVRLSYAGDAGELREGVARLRAFAERVWNPITGHHTATYHPMEVLA